MMTISTLIRRDYLSALHNKITASIGVILLGIASSSITQAALPQKPTDLCLQPIGNCTTSENVKWHPGHYVMGTSNFSQIYGQQYFIGVKVAYDWADLEPSPGVYDFSQIEKNLKELAANNKRLVAMVRYKTFNKRALDGKCAPDYIHNLGGVIMGTSGDGTPKCIAAIWRSTIADKYGAMLLALGQKFNLEPHFEAIDMEETAMGGVDATDLNLVTYTTGLQSIINYAKKAFPNTVVLHQANWYLGNQSAMDDFISYAYQNGIGLDGPDLIPGNPTDSQIRHKDYKGLMPLAVTNQRALQVGGNSVEVAFQWAVNNSDGLHANYVFWAAENTSPWDFENDIIPVINNHKGQINTGCPKNILCASQ